MFRCLKQFVNHNKNISILKYRYIYIYEKSISNGKVKYGASRFCIVGSTQLNYLKLNTALLVFRRGRWLMYIHNRKSISSQITTCKAQFKSQNIPFNTRMRRFCSISFNILTKVFLSNMVVRWNYFPRDKVHKYLDFFLHMRFLKSTLKVYVYTERPSTIV